MKYKDLLISIGDEQYSVAFGNENTVSVNKEAHRLNIGPVSRTSCSLRIDGNVYNTILIRMQDGNSSTGEMELLVNGSVFRARVDDNRTLLLKSLKKSLTSAETSFEVRAPMPGLVSRIEVGLGDQIKAGDGILILEAMKMENEIRSPSAGIVSEIRAKQGRGVERNEVLVVITSTSESES